MFGRHCNKYGHHFYYPIGLQPFVNFLRAVHLLSTFPFLALGWPSASGLFFLLSVIFIAPPSLWEMKQASLFGILFSSSYPRHPLPTSHFPQFWWPNTTAPVAYPEGHAVLAEEPRFLARRGDRAVIGKCRIHCLKLKL